MIPLLAVLFFALLVLGLWIRSSEKRMKTSFQALSYELMERNSKSFLEVARAGLEATQQSARIDLEQRQQAFEATLVPLRETMKALDKHQRELESKREGAYSSLSKQIEGMVQAETLLRKETIQLSNALRSPAIRGAWGQVHLRRVVELAGLLNQCDFEEQAHLMSDSKSLRPDVIVRLPGDRQIAIDAKTPLSAYLEAAETADENERRRKLEAHALHLKKHIKDLSQKDYWKGLGLNPEFVVLFLPAESFFSSALQIDSSLIEMGAMQNVIVATPTTLIAILRAVAHNWKQEAISKNAEQVARLGQELYERLAILSEHWSKVGRALTTAVDSYNQAVNSLESRVLVSARKLKDHGAAPINKELPALDIVDKLVRE